MNYTLPNRRLQLIIKRRIDLLFSLILLVVCMPLMLLVAILIRITMGGPVLFRQQRIGYGSRPFILYKFRTMTEERDADGSLLPDGKRLTRIGGLLRCLTFDELPELFNVLRGDMSLVGPRPLFLEYGPMYTSEQRRRHEMRPGMAGPVLAKGRNLLSWEEKFAVDLEYVDRWSLWLDMKLLCMSAWNVLMRRGISAPGHPTMPRYGESPRSHESSRQ